LSQEKSRARARLRSRQSATQPGLSTAWRIARVVGVNGGVAGGVGYSARGDYARAALHGLQHRKAEAFVERGVDESQRAGIEFGQARVGDFAGQMEAGLFGEGREIGAAAAGEHQVHSVMAAHLAPGLDQRGHVLARLERAYEKEVRGGGCGGDGDGAHPRRRSVGHRHHAVGTKSETVDRLAAHGLAGSHDHGGDAQLEEDRRAPPDAVGGVVPAGVHPGRKVVEREHAGAVRQVGHGEIGAVNQIGVEALHLFADAPQPPAALDGVARAAGASQIGRAGRGHGEGLVGEQEKVVVGETARQRRAQLASETRQSAARKAKRRGLNRHAHGTVFYGNTARRP